MLASYASILVLLSTITLALAHFQGTAHEHALRDANEYAIRRAYTDTCHAKLAARGYHQAGSERRGLMARQIRSGLAVASVGRAHDRKGNNRKRQLSTVEESHLSSGDYTSASDPFDSTTSGCVLQPDVTQGPYWVEGELIRTNVTDDEPGVPLYADFQIIDVSTCKPVSGVYLDFWHANSTGVYSGVIASGNGDSSDSTNLNNVALRGLQQTDSSGVAQFISVFPGHYTGRATHIHVMVHQTDGTLQSNGTYVNSTASHVGQVFFDQDLITQVEALEPYNSNTQTVTENSEDAILESVWDTFDPMMSYALIGDSLADGILAWSTIVINVTESSTVGAAAHYYETGGVAEDSGIGGGSGGDVGIGMGNGTAPSGMPGISGSPNASGSAGAIANTNGSGSTTTTRTASMGAISASASRGAAIKGRHLPAVFAWLA